MSILILRGRSEIINTYAKDPDLIRRSNKSKKSVASYVSSSMVTDHIDGRLLTYMLKARGH